MRKTLCCLVFFLPLFALAGCGPTMPTRIGGASSPADKGMQEWYDISVELKQAVQRGDNAKMAQLEKDVVPIGNRVHEELKKLSASDLEAMKKRWAVKFEGAGLAPPGGFIQ